MPLNAPLLLHHPVRAWSLDATCMGLQPGQLDGLPWDRAFTEVEALEAGAIANPDEQRQVGHYWLRAPDRAPTVGQASEIGAARQAVERFAAQVRGGQVLAQDAQPFTHVLHVGIGGSALGPQLLVHALDGSGPEVHFLDNTDPDGVDRTLGAINSHLRHTLVVVVSKSGGTAETMNAAALVRQELESQGLWDPQHFVAITQEGSKLFDMATREGWLNIFPMWDWVGGRTSLMSAVGLLPAALHGVDTGALLRGAAEMDAWTRHDAWRENPAALLAGCWHVAGQGRGERAMVVLPYSDRLMLFSRYLQQLVMESIGKRFNLAGEEVCQGLTVYGNKGSTDQHAYVQQLRDGRDDTFVTFIQVLSDGHGSPAPLKGGMSAGDWLQGFLLGTRRALTQVGRPSLTLTLPQVDAVEMGALIALFERAVGLYASLIRVNPYHQPGVEAGKAAANGVLELSRRLQLLLAHTPKTAAQLARELHADPIETWYVLQRLARTQRLTQQGHGPLATFRTRTLRDET